MKIEIFPLIVNVLCALYYTWKWEEPAKILYWGGAVVLTIGLYRMKG